MLNVGGCFSPVEMQQAAAERKIQWVWSDGTPAPGLEEMTEVIDVSSNLQRVLLGEHSTVSEVAFRDPNMFVAGEIHNHVEAWNIVLQNYHDKETILGYISRKVNIRDFLRPFNGVFKGIQYDSPSPPKKAFPNHPSCRGFEEFISKEIQSRILTGAVKVWGKVGVAEPPWLVLPLTVEPSKPRLCVDARFLNLWMADTPFSLDKLAEVPRFVYLKSFMTKLDDKAGYDHVLLTEGSRTYVGFEWKGWWFVNATLPFGWKNSPFIYQSIGLAAVSYLRDLGVACSLYIDDRLVGEIFTQEGVWSKPINQRETAFSKRAAESSLYIVCRVLIMLGYTLGLEKCVLVPTGRILFLGLLVDSHLQAFLIPEAKKETFAALRESLISRKASVPVKSLQKMMGKCISFTLAFPGAKFYIREMASAIGSAAGKLDAPLSPSLREELTFWRFLDAWVGHIPWRKEEHVALSISTDASQSRWAAVVHTGSCDLALGDYWEEELRVMNINVKEMWAVAKSLESLPVEVRDCRVDVQVDSQAIIHSWHGRGSRSKDLNRVAQRIFSLVTERNIALSMHYVPSEINAADWFSRRLSRQESMLSPRCWQIVQAEFGGEKGHTLDLMALDSNVMRDRLGRPLKHFTPYPTPGSAGVNVFNQDLRDCDGVMVNAYVFPPFALIFPLLRFLLSQDAVVTVVVPKLSPLPVWWPILKGISQRIIVLAHKGCQDALLFPTKQGFSFRPLSFDLLACRVGSRDQS